MITVDDDGRGIAASMRDAVLQRGVRADEAAPGSGFGLAIVRDLAELYGGSIALERVAVRRPARAARAADLTGPFSTSLLYAGGAGSMFLIAAMRQPSLVRVITNVVHIRRSPLAPPVIS